MGIAKGAARLLLDECSKRPFSGTILQLGRQKLFFQEKEFKEWSLFHNIDLVSDIFTKNSDKENHIFTGGMDDVVFFKAIGFDSVESCDYSDFQAADHVFDLNKPVPKHLHNKYDVILDSGTLEHVFHLPQVLKNIYDMLKVGGRVIHQLPASNWIDHGFYSFSPTLFYDYYTVNNWSIETSRIIELTRRHNIDPWRIYDYTPGALNALSSGGFDKGYLINIFFVVTKTENSSADIIPQQSRYLPKWETGQNESENSLASNSSAFMKIARRFFWGGLKKYPRLYSLLASLSRIILRKGNRMPPFVDRY